MAGVRLTPSDCEGRSWTTAGLRRSAHDLFRGMWTLPTGSLGLPDGPDGATTLGLRPEEIEIGRGDLRARVIAVEHLGAETVVRLDSGGQEFHAYAPLGRSVKPGSDVAAGLNAAAAMFFDADGTWVGNGA